MKHSWVYGWALLVLALAAGTPARAVLLIDYPASTSSSAFTFNADAAPQGDGSLQLTSVLQSGDPTKANYNASVQQRGSFFFNSPVNVSAFTTTFRFRLTPWAGRDPEDPWADGITFTLQNQGPDAIGGGGSFLGYAGEGDGIQPSVALKFKTFALGDPNNGGDPSISTVGVLVNGQDPTGSGIGLTDLLQFGPDFNIGSGATFRADITYNSGTSRFALTLTNEDTGRQASLSFTINIPAFVGGNSAYAGFTGGTGLFVADQRILSWQYDGSAAAPAPLRPTITSITPSSAPAGSASFPMTIRGGGFVPGGSSVTFNNTPVAVSSSSPTEIVVSVPASLLTTARVYNVIVGAGGRFSNAARFEVTRTTASSPAPAPLLRIVGNQRSGVDYFTGRHYVVFLFENQGSAPITGITFNSVRLQTGPSTFADFEFLEVEPGAQPPGSLGGMLPGQRLIVRFNFNIPPTGAGTVSVAGTSAQGNFNAGSRHVRFQ